MKIVFSQGMMDDLAEAVRLAFTRKGIVNIPQLAEEIRRRNEADNIALEDIASEVMARRNGIRQSAAELSVA
jgi:hypothetical protein